MSKSLEDLIPVILTKTKEKKIPWKMETADLFSAAIGPDRTLAVYELGASAVISLRGPASVELESVSTTNTLFAIQDIREIYALARHQALGVEKAIEDVEARLLSL